LIEIENDRRNRNFKVFAVIICFFEANLNKKTKAIILPKQLNVTLIITANESGANIFPSDTGKD
jgi:hypothetical protein